MRRRATPPGRDTDERTASAVVASDAHATEADRRWMDIALREARAAQERGEVPVGAAVVRAGVLLAAAGNASIATHDPSAHAELLAMRAAGLSAGNYRLPGAVVYATVEPCVMCMGAALHARVARIVYACEDPKAGAAATLYRLGDDPRLNHRIVCVGGVAADASRALLRAFFRARRGARAT